MAAVAAELELMSSRMAGTLSKAMRGGTVIKRLSDSVSREVVDDIYSSALKKQTGKLGPQRTFLEHRQECCVSLDAGKIRMSSPRDITQLKSWLGSHDLAYGNLNFHVGVQVSA